MSEMALGGRTESVSSEHPPWTPEPHVGRRSRRKKVRRKGRAPKGIEPSTVRTPLEARLGVLSDPLRVGEWRRDRLRRGVGRPCQLRCP